MKMKSLAFLRNVSQEQPIHEGFTPFIQEQQQAAKSGPVTVVGGVDAAIQAVAEADPLTTNQGNLVVLALRVAALAKTIIGKFGVTTLVRRIAVGPGGAFADATAAADGVAGTTKVAELTWDGGAKNNAPMTNAVADGVGGLSTTINARLATVKPSFSLSSVVSMIEDEALQADKEVVWVFDQNANSGLGKLNAYVSDTKAHNDGAYIAAVDNLSTTDAQFEQDVTPVTESEKLAGE